MVEGSLLPPTSWFTFILLWESFISGGVPKTPALRLRQCPWCGHREALPTQCVGKGVRGGRGHERGCDKGSAEAAKSHASPTDRDHSCQRPLGGAAAEWGRGEAASEGVKLRPSGAATRCLLCPSSSPATGAGWQERAVNESGLAVTQQHLPPHHAQTQKHTLGSADKAFRATRTFRSAPRDQAAWFSLGKALLNCLFLSNKTELLRRSQLLCLLETLQHYKHHWFPEKPCKGSGYRCIRINHKMDPLIGQAAQRIGLSSQELFQLLPSELTLWVDPYEVSYRIGEDGSICVLYEAAPAGGSQNNTNMQMVDSRISCKEELLLGRTSPSKSYNMMTVSG
nr:PREDICTED: protein BTG1 [Apteryx mantelli mantelli]